VGVPKVDAVVAGAGVAGLAAALELQDAGHEVTLLDPADRPGGVMRTDHVSGYVIERGPNTLQVGPGMLAFLRRRGLEDLLLRARPASRQRFIYRGDRLVQVPMSPLSLLTTPLLGVGGKLRLLLEPCVRRGPAEGESVAEFVSRRLGREVVSGLIGPFLTGVYAGDEDRLGARAVFGRLVALEQRFGSLTGGALVRAFGPRGPRGLRGSYSTEQGLGPFARRLADRLAEPPALGSRLTGLVPEAGRFRVEITGPSGEQQLDAARVVLAVPAFAAAELLRGVDPDAARALEDIVYAPIVGIPVGIDPADAAVPIEGFGFLASREAGLDLLGCLFMSRLFPSRAPEGFELLQCMLGGVRQPELIHEPDDVLARRVAADLERTLGLRGEPAALAVTRWPRAVPQPGRDHVARIEWVRARLREWPGLALAGSYLDGVGVSDALTSGVVAARALCAEGA
jgi:protoporphyrinogen/coproporphyrinogen III oxidase